MYLGNLAIARKEHGMHSVEDADAQALVQRAQRLVSRQQAVVQRRQDRMGESNELSCRLLDTMKQSLALVRRSVRLTSEMREWASLVNGSKAASSWVNAPGGRLPAGEPPPRMQALALIEAERRRIARELHDTVGQQLVAMRLKSAELQAHKASDTLGKQLAMLDSLVAAADAELDRAVFGLHPPALGEQGLVEAVSQQAALWSRLFGIPVDLLCRGIEKTDLSAAVVASLYRVVQESLTNIAKHAGASRVSIVLCRDGPQLRLSIEDDGAGFALARRPAGRLGLVGMRERIEALGGSFDIESAPGQGTTVLVSVPVQGAAAAPVEQQPRPKPAPGLSDRSRLRA